MQIKPESVQDLFTGLFVFRLRVFSQAFDLVTGFILSVVLLCYSFGVRLGFFLTLGIQS